MSIWRPHPRIAVKALGLVWRDGLLLASHIRLDDGTLKGVRPLGGHIEFGETWQTALIREFHEELGVQVRVSGAPIVLQNIYEHHGVPGHEVVFVADLDFPPEAYPGTEPFDYLEDQGQPQTAAWFDIETLDQGEVALYPAGLKAALMAR